jgi:hypothetical protein
MALVPNSAVSQPLSVLPVYALALGFPGKSGSPAGCVLLVRDFSVVELCSLVGATNDEQSPYQFT